MPTFGSQFPWSNEYKYGTYGTQLGSRVVAIGDFNGDGIGDFAIADPYANRVNRSYSIYSTYS